MIVKEVFLFCLFGLMHTIRYDTSLDLIIFYAINQERRIKIHLIQVEGARCASRDEDTSARNIFIYPPVGNCIKKGRVNGENN